MAELLNWALWRFDPGHVAPGFSPYTPEEIGRLRVECAATRSAQALIFAFVAGKRDPTLDYYAFIQIPDSVGDRISTDLTTKEMELAHRVRRPRKSAAQECRISSAPPDRRGFRH